MTDSPNEDPTCLLDRLRAICLALPEVSEQLNHGMPSWVVSRRTVVQFYDGPARDEAVVGLWAPAPAGVLEALLVQEPNRFYQPPYGGEGWLGLRLDREPDWDEVTAIVQDAYRLVAPKRLLARLRANAPSE